MLVSLALLSIFSVSIILDRRKYFKTAGVSEKAKALLESTRALSSDRQVWELQSFISLKKIELEKGLGWLATLGSNAPFIGLFGTVLGVLRAFGQLSTSQGEATSGIMSAISVSLIATAAGLAVAIPAVIAYNYFAQKQRELFLEVDSIRDSFLARKE